MAEGRASCAGAASSGAIGPVSDWPNRSGAPTSSRMKAQAWCAGLRATNIVTDVRDDVIRFGFGLYQDAEDVDRLIAACRSL